MQKHLAATVAASLALAGCISDREFGPDNRQFTGKERQHPHRRDRRRARRRGGRHSSNASEAGRQANRRVEIYVEPVVES